MTAIGVGIDTSLTNTGLAAIDAYGNIVLESVPTSGSKDATLYDRQERLAYIANTVVDFVRREAGYPPGHDENTGEYDPVLVCIEAPSYASRYGAAHDRAGLWWLIVNVLRMDGYAVALVSPNGRAKYGTGDGRSKKDVVMAHAIERYTDLLDKWRISNDDEADALILAAMARRRLGHPVEPVDPPGANLAAMEGVLWPPVEV